jgi:threonine 3-dehydrogenase
MAKMRAVQKTRPAPGVELVEVDIPKITDDQVLVKVAATAICGSDLHFYHWDESAQSRMTPPTTLGHEFCGDIVEVGKLVKGFSVGDYVSADSHVVCGTCPMCKMGLQHICQNLQIFGNRIDGSFAEYIAVPQSSLWPISRDVTPEMGAVLEPLGGAVQAVLIEPVSTKTVLVTGDGPIALFAAGVARAAGAAKVYLIGIVPKRLEVAKQMGADVVFNGLDKNVDPVKEILKDTNGLGVDVVVELAGAPITLKQAFDCVRKGGRVTLFGLQPKPLEIDINNAITLRQVTVRGVAGRNMWESWRQMDGLLKRGLDPRPVISHVLPLEQYNEGFKLLTEGDRPGMKVVLKP